MSPAPFCADLSCVLQQPGVRGVSSAGFPAERAQRDSHDSASGTGPAPGGVQNQAVPAEDQRDRGMCMHGSTCADMWSLLSVKLNSFSSVLWAEVFRQFCWQFSKSDDLKAARKAAAKKAAAKKAAARKAAARAARRAEVSSIER